LQHKKEFTTYFSKS